MYLTRTEDTLAYSSGNSSSVTISAGNYLHITYSSSIAAMAQASTTLSAYASSCTSSSFAATGTIPATYAIVQRSSGYSVVTSKCDFTSITDLGFTYYCMAHNSSAYSYPSNSWSWTGSNQTVTFYVEHGIYFYNGTGSDITVDCTVSYSLTTCYSINFVVCDVGTTAITS